MIYPPKLKKNSTIGIVTPSDIVEGKHIKELEFGINKLEEFGFDIFRSELFNIDEIRIKAKDLHNMFIDKKIDAIICAHGGDKSQEIIPYLDLDLIKNNPKIFMGMSDITPMLNHITAQTDLITFHGPDVRSIIGKGYFEKSLSEIERILIKGERNIGWYKDRKIIRKGVAKGRLVGGNLRCLLKLDDLNLFPDFENKILFLESLHCDEGELEEYFERISKLEIFDKINGIITGYIHGSQKDNLDSLTFENILIKYASGHDFPIIKINEFGHRVDNTILPIGSEVVINVDDKYIKLL